MRRSSWTFPSIPYINFNCQLSSLFGPVFRSPIYTTTSPSYNPLLHSFSNHLHNLPKLSLLLPIKSATPPCLLTPPNIRLDLLYSPKADNITYWRLITEIIDEYPNHIISFTGGSRARSKIGYAHTIQDSVTAKWMRNSASVFTPELSAIHSCIS